MRVESEDTFHGVILIRIRKMRIQVEEGAVWLEYSLHGHGPIKVFFVHGFATTVSSWRFQTEFFGNDHAHEYQICVMDNRGMGSFSPPTLFLLCHI